MGRPVLPRAAVRGSRCPRQASAAELPAHEHRLHGGHLRHGRRLLRKRRRAGADARLCRSRRTVPEADADVVLPRRRKGAEERRLGAWPHAPVLRFPCQFHAEPQPGPRRPHPRAAGSALCRDRRARLVPSPANRAARRLAAALCRVPDRPPSAYAVEGGRCALRKGEILWQPLRIRPR